MRSRGAAAPFALPSHRPPLTPPPPPPPLPPRKHPAVLEQAGFPLLVCDFSQPGLRVLQVSPPFERLTGLRVADALQATHLSFLCSGEGGAAGGGSTAAAATAAAASITDALHRQLSATVFLDAPARSQCWRVTATPLLGELPPRGAARARALALLVLLPLPPAEAEAAMAQCQGCGTVLHAFSERDLTYLLRGFQAHAAGFPDHRDCPGGEGYSSAVQRLNQRLCGLLWPSSPPGRPSGR